MIWQALALMILSLGFGLMVGFDAGVTHQMKKERERRRY